MKVMDERPSQGHRDRAAQVFLAGDGVQAALEHQWKQRPALRAARANGIVRCHRHRCRVRDVGCFWHCFVLRLVSLCHNSSSALRASSAQIGSMGNEAVDALGANEQAAHPTNGKACG